MMIAGKMIQFPFSLFDLVRVEQQMRILSNQRAKKANVRLFKIEQREPS